METNTQYTHQPKDAAVLPRLSCTNVIQRQVTGRGQTNSYPHLQAQALIFSSIVGHPFLMLASSLPSLLIWGIFLTCHCLTPSQFLTSFPIDFPQTTMHLSCVITHQPLHVFVMDLVSVEVILPPSKKLSPFS